MLVMTLSIRPVKIYIIFFVRYKFADFFYYYTSCPAFTMFIGISFPFFGGLLGFFGGFAFAPTTYFVSPENPMK